MRTRNERKRPLLTFWNSGLFRSENFVRGFIYSRASAKNPVPSQATVVISYPVGRPPLSRQPFLMLAVSKTALAFNASFFMSLRALVPSEAFPFVGREKRPITDRWLREHEAVFNIPHSREQMEGI